MSGQDDLRRLHGGLMLMVDVNMWKNEHNILPSRVQNMVIARMQFAS